jgi:hypothetical protein
MIYPQSLSYRQKGKALGCMCSGKVRVNKHPLSTYPSTARVTESDSRLDVSYAFSRFTFCPHCDWRDSIEGTFLDDRFACCLTQTTERSQDESCSLLVHKMEFLVLPAGM